MIFATRELKERIEKNIERLTDKNYCAPDIFSNGGDWPGDWQGRVILALCMQYEAGNRASESIFRQVKEIIDALPREVNEDGYFGNKANGESVNEQQLSGNSWFVRGLCAYYRITGEKRIYNLLAGIGEKMFLPLKKFIEKYPVGERIVGGVGGHIVKRSTEGWELSSDVGCAFISLDGLTDLCGIVKNPEFLSLAETMADKFLSFDYCGCKFQTHAMLSGTRGVLRLAELTGKRSYLQSAEKNFALYASEGTTVNYANFNWFRRPQTWTEPCAFVDSLILALDLYKATKKEEYLRFGNRVYLNAFRSAQRKNGGAGCETCLWENNDELRIQLYEANFCCSMRFADGLNCVREHSVLAEKSGEYAAYFTTGGEWISEDCEFAYTFDLKNSAAAVEVKKGRIGSLRLYMPEGVRLLAEERSGKVADFEGPFAVLKDLACGIHTFPLSIRPTEEVRAGRTVRFFADYLLTEKRYRDNSPIGLRFGERVFSPFGDCVTAEETCGANAYVQKI